MTSLSDLIRADLGEDFPISTGNGKVNDPIIITELIEYVAIEHVICKHALGMMREEFELEFQQVSQSEGRVIDEMVYAVKPQGAADWTGRRRFFFDITLGFNRLGTA